MPSGTTPVTTVSVPPAIVATMLVIGATVVATTRGRSPTDGPAPQLPVRADPPSAPPPQPTTANRMAAPPTEPATSILRTMSASLSAAFAGRATTRRSLRSAAMKVDASIPVGLHDAADRRTRRAKLPGYSGIWTAETPRPVPPAAARRRAHRDDRARHVDRGGVRPQPDDAGEHRLGPAGVLEGPLHPRARQPDQAAHHEALLDGVEPPGAAHARVGAGHAGHLGHLAERHEARLPRRVLHAHADDPVLHARPARPRRLRCRRRSSSPASAS